MLFNLYKYASINTDLRFFFTLIGACNTYSFIHVCREHLIVISFWSTFKLRDYEIVSEKIR